MHSTPPVRSLRQAQSLSYIEGLPAIRQNKNQRQMPQLFGSVYLSAGGSILVSGVATAELSATFMRKWKAQGFPSADCINPPGCMANAHNVAVLMLQGNKLKDGVLGGPNGNALYIPLKLISNENLDSVYPQVEGRPDYIWVTEILSADEWKKLAFK